MSENIKNNAFCLKPEEVIELIGLLDMALGDIEYRPVRLEDTEDSDYSEDYDFKVLSGSVREKEAYDLCSGGYFEASDFIGLTQESGVNRVTRRLIVRINDDELIEEADLDSGEIIFEEDVEIMVNEAEEKVSKAKANIMRVLSVLLEDTL